jgi:diguanylate cyclase (GGDEF)-like protein
MVENAARNERPLYPRIRSAIWALHIVLFALCLAQVVLLPSSGASKAVHGFLLGVLAAMLLIVNIAPGAEALWKRYQAVGVVAMIVAITMLAALNGGTNMPTALYAIPIAVAALAFGGGGATLVAVLGALAYTGLAMMTPEMSIRGAHFVLTVLGSVVPPLAVAWVLAVMVERAHNSAKRIEDLSSKDAATGLLNATAFDDVLQQEHRKAERFGRTYALIVVAANDGATGTPSQVNESGDRIATEVAGSIAGALRSSDVAARLGGAEFVVLSTECTPETAAAVVQRIRSAIDAGRAPDVRIGVANFPADHLYPRELLDLARKRAREDAPRTGDALVDAPKVTP